MALSVSLCRFPYCRNCRQNPEYSSVLLQLWGGLAHWLNATAFFRCVYIMSTCVRCTFGFKLMGHASTGHSSQIMSKDVLLRTRYAFTLGCSLPPLPSRTNQTLCYPLQRLTPTVWSHFVIIKRKWMISRKVLSAVHQVAGLPSQDPSGGPLLEQNSWTLQSPSATESSGGWSW